MYTTKPYFYVNNKDFFVGVKVPRLFIDDCAIFETLRHFTNTNSKINKGFFNAISLYFLYTLAFLSYLYNVFQ